MTDLEIMMLEVKRYIWEKKGVNVQIYLRNIRDINMLKELYEWIQQNANNKNTNN
jgi:hypothetical protein